MPQECGGGLTLRSEDCYIFCHSQKWVGSARFGRGRPPAESPGAGIFRNWMMEKNLKLAERIKIYRERLDMSIETLAEKSGVAAEVIRAVERGDAYPALGILVKLSRALGQRLGTFMDDQFSPDPVIVRATARTGEHPTHKAEVSGGFTYFPLGRGKPDRHMEPFYIEIAADADAQFSSHEGEEFIIVVSGEVELVYGEQTYLLRVGDSMYYNSVVQHIVRPAGGKPATIYAVVFMPF